MLPEIKEELGVALCVSKFFIWLLIKCPKDVRSCIGGILVRYLVVKHVQVHICAHLCTFGAQKTFSDDKNHNYFLYKLFGNTQPKKLLLLLVMDCGIMC